MNKVRYILTMLLALIITGCITVNAGKDQVVHSGDKVVLNGSLSRSIDNRKIKYVWKQIKGTKVALQNANSPKASFIAPDVTKNTSLKFLLTVSTIDGKNSNKASVSVMVKPVQEADTTPPVITLNGDVNLTLNVGDKYTELGATATDDKDGNVNVDINGTVDTSKTGTYTIIYTAKDMAGNIATINRKIEIKENGSILPNLNRDNTLAGVDNNNNGIRDDIDKYIDEHYTDPIKHAAVIQSAKVMQKALLVDKSDMDAIKKIDLEDNRAVNCLFSVFDPTEIPTDIESLTTNTKIRLLEYLKYNKALDGTVSNELEGDTCE